MTLCFLFALYLVQPAVSVELLARQAQEAIQAGRYSEAREKLREALKQAPRNPVLWSYLGIVDTHLNELDAGIADFQKVLSLAPRDAQTHFNLGLLYRRKGNIQKALAMYQRGLGLDPNDAGANQNYALLLMETGKFREAIPFLTKLRALGNSDVSVAVALIESFLKAGMKEEGTREIQVFLQAPNVTFSDQFKLAKVLIEDKQPVAARFVLEHVVRIRPDLAEAHAQLGQLLAEQDQYEDAAREMGQAVRLSPETVEYSMRLAEILILWKQYPTAAEFLSAVKDRFGHLPEYQYKLGLTYFGLHHIQQAIAVFENLAREHPSLDLVQFFLGNFYQTTGDYEKAESHYRRAIELNPAKASHHAALAQLLRKDTKDRTDEALIYLEKALSLDPQDLQSKLELALCHEKKTSYPTAERLLEQVVREQPDLIPAHVALARVYYRQKKKALGDRERLVIAQLEAEQQAKKSQSAKPSDVSTP
ncbi:MAG: tetratricopeptide repeat protein [Acidobacteriota bacterium]